MLGVLKVKAHLILHRMIGTDVLFSAMKQTPCQAPALLLCDGHFRDHARLMYQHYARHNVPTYIIGPELGGGPMAHRPANILKVWPQRGPMECLRPDELNPHIIGFAT